MSGIISGNYTTVQTLSSSTPRETITGTINAYGSLGKYVANISGSLGTYTIFGAVFGPSGTDFTVTNDGLIETQGSNPDNLLDVGIVLGSPGSVINAGTILGASGVAIFDKSGSGASYLENSKLISGSIGVGIALVSAGTVKNSGSIFGAQTGVEFGSTSASYFSNFGSGTVTAATNYAVELTGGGIVINAGLLSGNNGGVNLVADGTIRNSGTIEQTATATAFGYAGINVVNNGTIFNSLNGVIKGEIGISVYGSGSSYVYNDGKITGSTYFGVYLGRDSGNLVNKGVIKGYYGGVQLGNPGSVFNGGTIENTATGTSFYNIDGGIRLRDGGSVTNTGLIESNQLGIVSVYGPGIITNSGIVEAFGPVFTVSNSTIVDAAFNATGVYLRAGGTITNEKDATIAGNYAVRIAGGTGTGAAVINSGTIIGTFYGVELLTSASVSNSGLIESTIRTHFQNASGGDFGGAGIAIEGGAIVNQAGGTIIGYNGVSGFSATVTVNNYGYIAGTGAYAAVYLGAGGTVINHGTIKSQSLVAAGTYGGDGINIHHKGTVINTGLISGGFGVYFKGTGSLNNSGTIIVATQAFNALDNAKVTNTGLLAATGSTFVYKTETYLASGVALSAGGTVTNTAGTIIGGGAGIVVYNDAGLISNSAIIESTGTGPFTIANTIGGTLTVFASGIDLLAGGTVANNAGGMISGVDAIVIEGSAGSRGVITNAGTIFGTEIGAAATVFISVNNSGLIEGSITTLVTLGGDTFAGIGLNLLGGGSVTNQSHGTISGAEFGILLESTLGSGATVNNTGLIEGTGTNFVMAGSTYGSQGVLFVDVGGTLTNNTGGTISGVEVGVDGVAGAAAGTTVNNSGLIQATGTKFVIAGVTDTAGGVILSSGGKLINEAGGVITGYFGALAAAGSSTASYVQNFGSIIGTGIDSVGLELGGSSSLNNASGGFISGPEIGVYMTGGGSAVNEVGGNIAANIGFFSKTNGTFTNAGTVTGTGGLAALFEGTDNKLVIDPGAVFNGAVAVQSGGGSLELASAASSGMLTGVGSDFSGFSDITFDTGARWLLEGNSLGLGSGEIVTGFALGDTINLDGFTETSYSYVAGAGLEISNGIATDTLDIVGNFSTSSFLVQTLATGTEFMLCYLRGTRLLSPTGEVPVEGLKIGDPLLTRYNGIQKIKWIGRQSFAGKFIQNNRDRIPVRIKPGALSENQPVRDLYVSPGHSMLVDGTLLLAKMMVNGVSVTQDEVPYEVHYYLIEFAMHDCVIAAGTWGESFADGPGLRNQFHNAPAFLELNPDYVAPEAVQLCAPRPEHGEALELALRPVVARAVAQVSAGPLRGSIDVIEESGLIEGWAQDEGNPELPVLLDVLLQSEVIGSVLACHYRADLAAAGIGGGRCHFIFRSQAKIPADALSKIKIRRAKGAAEIFASEDCKARIGVMEMMQKRLLAG